MRLPNLYLWFSNRDERIVHLYMVMGIPYEDFISKRRMQSYIDRMEVGAKSSPYYRIYEGVDIESLDESPITLKWLYRRGLNRIYFRRTVDNRFGDWLVLQFRRTPEARSLYLSILSDSRIKIFTLMCHCQ
jgi:hypothetical protein